jgi:hypothetical protein
MQTCKAVTNLLGSAGSYQIFSSTSSGRRWRLASKALSVPTRPKWMHKVRAV